MARGVPNPVAHCIKRLGGMHAATVETGIPRSTLERYRRDGYVPTLGAALKLAKAAGINVATLQRREAA